MGEVPLLQELRNRYEGKGAVFLGVSMDEDLAALDRMVARQKIPWPQLADGKGPEGAIPQAFRVRGYPFFYLLDRAGRIFNRFESASQLESTLAEALGAPPDGPAPEPRDTWQHPTEVMDRLGLKAGSVVADVGSGGGYFTLRLATRVGPTGRVLAVDIDEKALARLRERAQERQLAQIEVIHGEESDPTLPPESADAILVVDSYHEFRAYDLMLRGMFRALKPGGRLGILDSTDALGKTRAEYQDLHRLPPEVLIEDAARHGFRLRSFEADYAGPPGDPKSYFLIFEKPRPN